MTPLDKPKVLDLCCKAGGASMGLYRAGFDVTGVDIEPQPRYPFRFVRADAMEYPLDGFDFIWASPPCQKHVKGLAAANVSRGRQTTHIDLIARTRARLARCRIPFVIENVEAAPLVRPIRLCGSMFGLPIRRHRLFESTLPLMAPTCQHNRHSERIYGTNWRPNGERVNAFVVQVYGTPAKGEAANWRKAMGIDWMSTPELAEAIPPAYSEFIGRQAIQLIGTRELCI